MQDPRFRTTQWSLVLAARDRGDPGAEQALAELCECYWYPLYLFVRRSGHAHDEALDLTQGYFLRLMERDYLGDVKPEAGRFRSFLLASLKHFLMNTRRDASRLKRGGGQALLSLDAEDADGRYRIEAAHDDTPDKAFERVWAQTVIDRAKSALGEEMANGGKSELWEQLRGYLTGTGDQRPYREIAEELQTSEAAVKMNVSRLRRRFAQALREEIARTVDDPDEVDAEIRYLLNAVR